MTNVVLLAALRLLSAGLSVLSAFAAHPERLLLLAVLLWLMSDTVERGGRY